MTVAVLRNGVEIDPWTIPLPLMITHGRSSVGAQPDAPTVDFEVLGAVAPCEVGDHIRVTDSSPIGWVDTRATWADPGVSWLGDRSGVAPSDRFVGEVDQILAVELDGEVVSWEIHATGLLANLGRIPVRVDLPAQSDVQRVQAIAAKAGVVINIAGTDSLMLAADELDRDCLDALHEVCKSTGGLLWQARDGSIWYGTSNHRDRPTDWVLPAGAILDGLEWANTSEQVLNYLTIRYPRAELPPAPLTGEWTWDPSLDTGSDPGTGDMRANDVNATQISTIALSATTNNGVDATLSISRRLADDRLYIQVKNDSTQWARYTLTGPPVDNGAWFTVPVDFKEHGDSGEPVQNNQAMLVAFDSRLEGGEVQETFTDDASIGRWGFRAIEFSTLCLDANAASLLALTILARRAQPYWVMPGVMVPTDELSVEESDTMQALDVSVGILAPAPAAPGPTPAPVEQWAVEGFVEEWNESGHWMQLALSEWIRSSSSATRTWDVVRQSLTYDQARAKTYRELLVEVS